MRKTTLLFACALGIFAAATARSGAPDRRAQVLPPAAQGAAFNRSLFDPAVPPATTALTVTQIDIVQGIQDIDNDVPILAGRRAFARVFFDATTPAGWGLVSGTLNVVGPDGQAVSVSPYSSISTLTQWNGQLELKRDWDPLGLLFEIPASSVAAGQLTVNLASAKDMWNGGAAIPCANCSTLTRSVAVTATAPLRLTVIGLQYDSNGQSYAPRQLDYDLIRSWLVRAYPISGITYNTRQVAATSAWPFDCGAANAQVAAIRALDVAGGTDHRTHYYGLVADGGGFMRGCAAVPAAPNPAAIGSGPTGPDTFGWDFDGSYGDWYTGHELGHTLGRSHVGGFCGEAGTDPNYPFANGQLADANHPYVGYDIGDPNFPAVLRRAAPGRASPLPESPVSIWHDVMSYCTFQWVSSYTYEGIRTRLVAEEAMPPAIAAAAAAGPAPGPGGLMHVVARLDEGWTAGTIDALNRVGRASANPPAPADSPAIVLLDGSGKVVSRTPVTPLPLSDLEAADAAHPPALISAAVPITGAVRSIHVEYRGKPVATRSGGSASPTVALRAPAKSKANAAAGPGPGGSLLQWSGRHPEGKALTYSVLLSGDGGKTWETHATGLKEPRLAVPPATVARLRSKGRPIPYRIVASDGFNSAETAGRLQ